MGSRAAAFLLVGGIEEWIAWLYRFQHANVRGEHFSRN